MQFNSLTYFIFLPIVFALHWILPHKHRWISLLIASYYFYMSWNAKYVVLILFTTAVSYCAAILIERAQTRSMKKGLLVCVMLLCLGVLFFFKYFNFFSKSLIDLLGLFSIHLHPVTLSVLLPVGISFYTFQTLSYVIDVYRGNISAEKHFGIYALFVSFFPQLVAGPIERTSNLMPQIKAERKFSYEQGIMGLRKMIWGFFKKVAIADTVAVYVDRVYSDLTTHRGFDFAVAIFFFTVQIYCDFSGYSDIAIGTAKLLGINLMTNFKNPYFSASIQEFWSRWHISLSQWFRDYVYIPLGGNRCSKAKHYRNILITFLISGLWHGANWSFVLWGGLHGCVQIIEQIFENSLTKIRRNRIGRAICIVTVFILCNLGWVLFRAESATDAAYIIIHVFDDIMNPSIYLHNTISLSKGTLFLILIGISSVGIFDYIDMKQDALAKFDSIPKWCRCVIGYSLIITTVFAAISSSGANQFVYFQF